MINLLQKTRLLNKILQKNGAAPVIFDDICNQLGGILEANIYIISRKGKILGSKLFDDAECDIIKHKIIPELKFPSHYNTKLLVTHETHANVPESDLCVFDNTEICTHKNKLTTIVPINGAMERLGTILLSRFDKSFDDDDLVLAEYSATIVGLEILRARAIENEEETRKKAIVELALGTLSFSELEAVEHIINELDGNEGLLVASKIADKAGITRSVIVNALRKFESAGVIESRSLGMKGTYIRILNEKLFEQILKNK